LANRSKVESRRSGFLPEVLNFAEHVILDAARLWTEFSSEQKQRLQKVFFPQGVTFAEGNYKTRNVLIFQAVAGIRRRKNKFGDPIGNRTRATAVKGQCPNR